MKNQKSELELVKSKIKDMFNSTEKSTDRYVLRTKLIDIINDVESEFARETNHDLLSELDSIIDTSKSPTLDDIVQESYKTLAKNTVESFYNAPKLSITNEDVIEALRNIACNFLGHDPLYVYSFAINSNTTFREISEIFRCDSLEEVELLIDIEIHFNISIPDSELSKIKTVEDLRNFINKTLLF